MGLIVDERREARRRHRRRRHRRRLRSLPARAGWRVTVLDRGEFGDGCSHANCGYVCPSHVLPLAAPGAIRGTLKSLFARNSPFKIRPATAAGACGAGCSHFARRCNTADMLESGRGIQPLLNRRERFTTSCIRDEPRVRMADARLAVRLPFARRRWSTTPRRIELLAQGVQHCRPSRTTATTLNHFEPALKPGLGGGWLYEGDAHLRPDRLMSSWRASLEARA